MNNDKNTIKYSAYCVLAALATLSTANAQAAHVPVSSPYSTTPLHFKTTTSNSAKPNVMLFLDDSGSMSDQEFYGWPVVNGQHLTRIYRTVQANPSDWVRSWCKPHQQIPSHVYLADKNRKYKTDKNGKKELVNIGKNGYFYCASYSRPNSHWQPVGRPNSSPQAGIGVGKTKLQELKQTLNKLIAQSDDEKYKSANYWWGMEVLNKTKNRIPLGELTPQHKANILNKINGLTAQGATPSTWRYYRSAMAMVDQMQYRCQPNHLILLSDGEANDSFVYPNSWMASSPVDNDGVEVSTVEGRDRVLNIASEFKENDTPMSWRDFKKSISGRDQYSGRYFWVPQGIVTENSLAFLSKSFAELDLKRGGVDADQVSWDDKAFPPQTITTHTIAFGKDVLSNAKAKAYLERGAQYGGGLYKEAKDAEALLDAFGEILKAKVKPFKGYTSVAPAVINTDVAGIAATATLDSGDWSSQLQFFRLDSKGDVIEIDKKPLTQAADFPALSAQNRIKRRVVLADSNGVRFFDGPDAKIKNADVDIASLRNGSSGKKHEWAETFIPWLARYNNMKDSSINKSAADNSGNSNLRYRIRAKDIVASPQRHMGDVIGAPILALGKRKLMGTYGEGVKDYKYEYLLTATNDGMVHIFTAERPKKEGSLVNKSFKPYALRISYIPGGIERSSADDTILKNLKWQMKPNYGKTNGAQAKDRHIYLLNGGIASRTTDANGTNRQTFIVGNAGQGGKGVYALNVGGSNRATGHAVGVDGVLPTVASSLPQTTGGSVQSTPVNTDFKLSSDINKWNKSLPLWMKSGGGLGYTVSTPGIGRIATKWTPASLNANGKTNPAHADLDTGVRYAAFIANGYDGSSINDKGEIKTVNNKSALYIYDALGQEVGLKGGSEVASEKGKLLKKLEVTGNGTGLSSPTPVDINRDGVVDVVYAGDYSGNMYRFDLRGGIANWKVTKIFQGDPSQPITAAPSVKPRNKSNQEYVVLFGTGSDIYDDDLQNNSKQSFFGIYDDLNKDLVEITSTGNTFAQGNTSNDHQLAVAKRENLRKQVMSLKNGNIREIELKNWSDDEKKAFRGWVIDLVSGDKDEDQKGERVVTKANVLGETVFFSTRSYLSEADQQAKVCTSSTSSGFSWLMGVNADDGGRLTRKNTRFVDKSGKPVFYSGIKFSGILSPIADSFSGKINSDNAGSDAKYGPAALDENNEMRSTGYDNPLGVDNNKRPRRLICGVQEGANALFFTASDTGFGKMGIQAADCPDPRRISWRELF